MIGSFRTPLKESFGWNKFFQLPKMSVHKTNKNIQHLCLYDQTLRNTIDEVCIYSAPSVHAACKTQTRDRGQIFQCAFCSVCVYSHVFMAFKSLHERIFDFERRTSQFLYVSQSCEIFGWLLIANAVLFVLKLLIVAKIDKNALRRINQTVFRPVLLIVKSQLLCTLCKIKLKSHWNVERIKCKIRDQERVEARQEENSKNWR